jgi:hypothetical protein
MERGGQDLLPAAFSGVRKETNVMSGPIVRKYGFPNFEKIFGARELQHGVDEPEAAAGESAAAVAKPKKSAKASTTDQPASKTPKRKKSS